VNAALAALVDAATVDPVLAADLAADPARIVELVAAGGPGAATPPPVVDPHPPLRPAP
jgi:hypothetical protein